MNEVQLRELLHLAALEIKKHNASAAYVTSDELLGILWAEGNDSARVGYTPEEILVEARACKGRRVSP